MELLDLFFSKRCKLCSKNISSGAVCKECDKSIISAISPRERKIVVGDRTFFARSLFDYDNEMVQKLLFTLKRSANGELFEYCARLYENVFDKDECNSLVYVPRSRVNSRKYGYDHMQKVSRALCKNEGIKYSPILKRRPFTKEQKKLDKTGRAKNVANAFVIKKNDIPQNIVLIDDVVTTGSSAAACVREILKRRSDAEIKLYFLASK